MKKNEKIILRELMAHPTTADRTVAVRLGFSQPTISRIRHHLEQTGIIRYEIIPDLEKLGFEILAFTTIEPTDRIKDDNTVIYATDRGRQMFVISVHKNYRDYSSFAYNYEVHWEFLVATYRKSTKPLSFKNII
ncbi:unnamed protein product [marine sediment metagenome]|uniref:HTH asnC-type domain-containing protein n=1 Tax=marine sediment metagenome TaxID=412755 RepID=X0ZBK6_9ZZZZ